MLPELCQVSAAANLDRHRHHRRLHLQYAAQNQTHTLQRDAKKLLFINGGELEVNNSLLSCRECVQGVHG